MPRCEGVELSLLWEATMSALVRGAVCSRRHFFIAVRII